MKRQGRINKPDKPARMKGQGRTGRSRIKYPAERHPLCSANYHLIKMTGESFSCHFFYGYGSLPVFHLIFAADPDPQ